jgi:nicotinamidase-related amidase
MWIMKGNKHALVIIDMLNDFIGPKAALRCAAGEEIVPNIQKLIASARENGIQIIHVQEAHRKNDADFRVRPVHAIKGTWGHQFLPELMPDEDAGDYVIQKRRHSGFSYTDMDLFLREEGIDTVVLTGVWTNVCVRSTASDALYHGYNVICISDGTASQDQSMHESGLRDIALFGEIISTDEYIEEAKAKFGENQSIA